MRGTLARTAKNMDVSARLERATSAFGHSSPISAIATGLRPRPGEQVIEADGAALLPGLHDHHLHLASLAAALE